VLHAITQLLPRRAGLLVLLVLLMAPWPSTVSAQSERLEEVERAISRDQAKAQELAREREQVEAEILTLQADSLTAAKAAQDQEEELTVIEETLAAFESEAVAKARALNANRGQLGRTLTALQRIALQPPEALIVAPGTPIDTARSALLLRASLTTIEERAQGLRSDLDDLARLGRDIAEQRRAVAAAVTDLDRERGNLSALLDRKRALRADLTTEQKAAQARAARLAEKAKDLRELIARLREEAQRRAEAEAEAERKRAEAEAEAERLRAEAEAERLRAAQQAEKEQAEQEQAALERAQPEQVEPEQIEEAPSPLPRSQVRVSIEKPKNVRPFPTEPSATALVMPARGKLLLRYGQAAESGDATKGITIGTRDAAQVVAPFDGLVAYAGEFRGYGRILIIEHGERYHTLLAGLERIDAVIGQWVLAGEPVGTMGHPADDIPKLYLELRRTGEPINPLPWLATSDRVRG
jgi:septal ring factor EnvC (AmiA/AmiB activator)